MRILDYKRMKTAEPTAVTIGNFDGVHNGHKFLIRKIKEQSAKYGAKTAVLTFSPHPKQFFEPEGFLLITTVAEKSLIFDRLGVDYKVFLEFNMELSSLEPAEFVETVLVKALNCKYLAVGENFGFGKNRSGNARTLKALCSERGIGVDYYESVQLDGGVVSSARIRGLLAQGDVYGANILLGSPYFTYGEIVHGKSLGRTLGFPTINQIFDKSKLLPKNGVFFTKTIINGKEYNGVTNVGVRPTLGGTEKSVETFLLDFDSNVYGETAEVRFIKRHRDEMKFESIEALREAILNDKRMAAAFFAEAGENEKS